MTVKLHLLRNSYCSQHSFFVHTINATHCFHSIMTQLQTALFTSLFIYNIQSLLQLLNAITLHTPNIHNPITHTISLTLTLYICIRIALCLIKWSVSKQTLLNNRLLLATVILIFIHISVRNSSDQ